MKPQFHLKYPRMSNETHSIASKGLAGKRVCAAVLASALMLLPGCEYMGSAIIKKETIPDSLVVQGNKLKEPTADTAPVEKRGATQEEIYPATGTLFGSPIKADEESVKHTIRPREGKYTLNFEDAELGEVAKVILGDTLKVNYVISPKVTGKVSLQTTHPLTDEEMIPTLEMLLKTNGAVLIKDHSLYRIEPEASGTVNASSVEVSRGHSIAPGFQLRVVPLRYVGVAEMKKIIEPLMPPKSVVHADESRNLLLLAATADELESVLETISIFDVDFMRGMSVGLFPLKNVDASTVAEELDKLLTVSGKGPLTGMFRLMPIERLQSIMVVSPQPRYLDEVQSWIERLDRYNPTKTNNLHVYRVQNVDALELANTVAQIFGKGNTGSRTPGASLAPGMTGSSLSGGGGASSGFGGSSSSGFGGSSGSGGSSSSGFGGSSSSGLGGSSSSGLGGSSSSGLGGSSSSGFGGSSSSGMGGTTGSGTSQFGSGSSTGSGTSGGGSFGSSSGGGSFGSGGGGGGQQNRSSQVADLGNGMKVVADPNNNTLIIMAKPQDYRDIEAVIKQLDIMPLQVLIDATILEVQLSGALQYGLQWYFSHQISSDLGSAGFLGTTLSATAAAAGGFTYVIQNSAKNLQIQLDALASSGKSKVLSSPSLMVLNNQKASIKVGNQVPILTGQALNTGGNTNFVGSQSIQYKDIGVKLQVRPRVNAGGLVSMELAQAVDDEVNGGSPSPSGIQSPTFTQRTIESQVAVRSGETLVLGGLIKEGTNYTKAGIPLLSELPWLGSLFGSTVQSTVRDELVVLLTPRVVENSISSRQITNEYRRRLGSLYEQKPPSPASAIMEQGGHLNLQQ